MTQYAAKLLFQWNPEPDGVLRQRRLCEERIITFTARTPQAALRRAKAWGRRSQFAARYSHALARLEFIGVRELMELGTECEPGEVWYELRRLLRPRERRNQLIPRRGDLWAFKDPPRDRRRRPGRPRGAA